MRKKQKLRMGTTLHKDADKSSLELSNKVFQRSIDQELWMVGGVNGRYLKEYSNFMISRGNKIRSIESKLKVVRYFNDFLSKKKRSPPTMYRHNSDKKKIEVIEGKSFKKATRKDVEAFFGSKKLMPRTLEGYKIKLKVFFQWLYSCKEKEYPPVVDWIKTTNPRREFVEESEIINKDEIQKMIKHCLYLRDKAIIMLLYDSAVRVSEASNLKISDIYWDQYGAKILVDGKTGKRKIRLSDSVPLLKQWVNQHPMKEDLSKNVFVRLGNQFGTPMVSQGIYKMMEKTRLRAGIKRKIRPHLLRHTRLTELASNGFNEMELRLFAGWSRSSTMPEVYLHIGEKDLDNKIRGENGLVGEEEKKKKEEERVKLKPRDCPMCGEKNDVNNKFCSKCGQILDIKALREIQSTQNMMAEAVMSNPDMKEQIINDLKEKLKEEMRTATKKI